MRPVRRRNELDETTRDNVSDNELFSEVSHPLSGLVRIAWGAVTVLPTGEVLEDYGPPQLDLWLVIIGLYFLSFRCHCRINNRF